MHENYTPKKIGRPPTPIDKRFWSKVDKSAGPDACWIWTAFRDKDGYGHFGFEKTRSAGAHRVSWILAFGDIPDGLLVCHTCDNPSCVNPSHLFLGTNQDNMSDRDHKGRHGKNGLIGENIAAHKLTEKQVSEIRSRYAWHGIGGDDSVTLAKEYGVSSAQILQIAKRVWWKHC